MKRKVIETKNAPAAVGAYSQGINYCNLIFTSGQLPINPTTGEHERDNIATATAQCIENMQAILEEAGSSLNNVLKVTIFLSDMQNFAAMNEVFARYFEGSPPARSCVQVAKLPLDAIVEMEAIASLAP